ncbi:MAG: AI-2E family transporter [Clostridia bacterium]|nr:AI-2E family transporter [Clostridia bacterium]
MTTKRRIVVYIVSILILIGLVWFVYHFKDKLLKVITPFSMALVIAYLLNPLVKRMERKRIPRTVSILVIYLMFSILTVVITVYVIPEIINNVRDLINTLPSITAKYQGIFNRLMSIIQTSQWPTDVKNSLFREIQNGVGAVQEFAMGTLKKTLSTLAAVATAMLDLILALIIAYYFIKDGEFFKKEVLSLAPKKWRNGIVNTGREINQILSNFIQGQLLTALMVGILETIGLMIVKVKYPLVLGLVGGLANIIPYFGPVIGAIPAVVIALLESPLKALWAAVVFAIVQQIDNAFISPKIIEGKLGLHPVTTILAVIVGGEFFGIIGMLISVPVTAILKVIAKKFIESIV